MFGQVRSANPKILSPFSPRRELLLRNPPPSLSCWSASSHDHPNGSYVTSLPAPLSIPVTHCVSLLRKHTRWLPLTGLCRDVGGHV